MTDDSLDPKVLGQLILMQSYINNLPGEKSIFRFVCKGLADVPGISRVRLNGDEENEIKNDHRSIVIPIILDKINFGELIFEISDIAQYELYEPYVKNFVFMIGLVLEQRLQRKIIEQKILERTRELNTEKENLVESQRRFTDLMKNIKLISLMLDTNGNITFCNNYLLSITKYSSDEILGKNWFDIFISPDARENVKSVFSKMIENGNIEQYFNYENEIKTKDGDSLIIAWNNTLLRDSNKKIIGTASIGENITERKKAEILLNLQTNKIKAQNEELFKTNNELIIAKEKAEESDRLKSAFLANMSHEIRTPMNGILGFSELLMNSDIEKDNREHYIDLIHKSGLRMLKTINDLIDISRIESGQIKIIPSVTDLKEITDYLYNFFSLQINDKDLSLNFIRSETQKKIITDKEKLIAILTNLIRNAIKFTDKGYIEVGYTLEKNTLECYVKDTGIGIAANHHKKIFERFVQANVNVTNIYEGSGLGLSISKAFVEKLDGRIWVESKEGEGSTFKFTIPVSYPQI